MITSPDNEKLKTVRRLRARKGRRKEGMFVTEGEDLLEAGMGAGREPVFALVSPDSGLAGEPVAPELLAEVSALGSGTRVIAVWELPAETDPGLVPPVAYLHGISDPGNIGAIIRTAQAFGAGVVLGPDCADPYGSKAVRASMGAIFACRLIAGAGADSLPGPTAALVAHGGAGLGALAGCGSIALGSERDGLPAAIAERCERSVTIPLAAGAVESLNVAAAAAIALQRVSSPAVETNEAEQADG